MALVVRWHLLPRVSILRWLICVKRKSTKPPTNFGRLGAQAETFVADVSDFAKAQDVAQEIVGQDRSINVLLNNVGIESSNGLLEISEAEWDRTIDINLKL